MKYFSIAIIFLFGLQSKAAGTYTNTIEDSLIVLLGGIAKSSEDVEKKELSDRIDALLQNSLSNPEMFTHDFNRVKKMAILKPEDDSFRLFNWNIPLNNGVNEFRCYIITPAEDMNMVHELTKPKRPDKKLDSRYLELDRWYGCLYYDIVPIKKGKKTYYTLLGYSPDRKAATKKYIDVLTINNGRPRLGAPIFKSEKGMKKRVIFEFSAEVSMTVRWQEETKRIILDHLEPRSPEMQGNYQFYGPDGTFDAYILMKDTWELQKGVDFRSIEKSDKTYRDPRFFRKRKK